MFDKMKQFMDLQKKMQELKNELDNTTFEIQSSDKMVTITMNGSMDVRDLKINNDLGGIERQSLEKSIRDAVNKSIKRSQALAAEKMKGLTGLNLPGL